MPIIWPLLSKLNGQKGKAPFLAGKLSPPDLGGGAGAISGTASLTFGQTGSLAGAGVLSGTTTVVFGQTGTLRGVGALNGSVGITFAQTGTLGGSGALSGSAAVTFAQTASLLGFGALNGTATATFGQSGNLSSMGALAGTATLVFGQSGNLTSGMLAGDIAGTATLIFGQSGLLGGNGVLSGSGPIVFGQSGILADASAASALAFGNAGAWRDDEQERHRQRRFKELADAERELRATIAALVRGDKPAAIQALDRALDDIEAIPDDVYTAQIETLRKDIIQLTISANLRQTQVRLAAQRTADLRQMMDDDEAISFLLLL